MTGPEAPFLPDDPALDAGEWLFRRRGEVFGPVASRALAAMLYRGELDASTPVSSGDGRWAPLGEVPLFQLHARKAEAALRIEAEVTGARKLRARRSRAKLVLAAVGVAVLAVVGVALSPPFRPLLDRLLGHGAESPLLEDFGQGIRIAGPTRIGVSGRSGGGADEIEVAFEPAAPDAPAARAPVRHKPAAAQAAPPAGGDLVVAQFDVGRIQAVVNRQQRTLAPCFKEEAARWPELRGDVPLEFAIGNDGRVVALWIDDPRFREGPLRECLTRALAAWRFDPFPGQRPTVQLAFSIGR
ncbi:MAG: AgmX/PglI C-terminal domain-containing protein [Anaeromyxobacter sp.]